MQADYLDDTDSLAGFGAPQGLIVLSGIVANLPGAALLAARQP